MGQSLDAGAGAEDSLNTTAQPRTENLAQPGGAGSGDQPQPNVDRAMDLFADQQGSSQAQGDQANANAGGQKVDVGKYGEIDLHVKDLALTKVLQLLSIQSQRNIIASRNVSGSVSADLYGVSFHEALDAILQTNGFAYQEKGNFIYVYTQEEYQQIQQEQRETVTRIVRLNYLNAKDASAFVSPMLSDGGTISVSGETEAGFQPSVTNNGENSFAHPDTLILRDYAENVDKIAGVLEELDTRPKQILVEATVLQADLTENNAFGVDFALFSDLDIEDFTSPLNAVDDLIDGNGAGVDSIDSGNALTSSVAQDTIGQSSVKVGFLGSDAAMFVRALDQVTDTTVLATPKLLVLNRQKADLLVGERLGYISTTQTEASQTQTVEFLDIGTQLTVRPFIGEDQFIRMELRPSVSDGSTTTTAGLVIPNTTNSELTTNVIVRNTQTVVLGGLFKEDTSVSRSQVPGLGDIPIVGNLGKAQDDNVSRTEVIFMIKPTIMKDRVLTKTGEAAEDAVQAARIGARRNLLPWSNTKLTSSHMREAFLAMEAGDRDKALWNANLALHIDPTHVDAMRLKAKLTGEQMYLHDESLLKDMVSDVIREETGDDGDAVNPQADDVEILELGRSLQQQPHRDAAEESAIETANQPVDPQTPATSSAPAPNESAAGADPAEANPQANAADARIGDALIAQATDRQVSSTLEAEAEARAAQPARAFAVAQPADQDNGGQDQIDSAMDQYTAEAPAPAPSIDALAFFGIDLPDFAELERRAMEASFRDGGANAFGGAITEVDPNAVN